MLKKAYRELKDSVPTNEIEVLVKDFFLKNVPEKLKEKAMDFDDHQIREERYGPEVGAAVAQGSKREA